MNPAKEIGTAYIFARPLTISLSSHFKWPDIHIIVTVFLCARALRVNRYYHFNFDSKVRSLRAFRAAWLSDKMYVGAFW